MTKPQVAVIFGGISNEHEISCLSAASILREINREKYSVQPIGITKAGSWVAFKTELEIIKSNEKLPSIDQDLINQFAVSAPTLNPPLELVNSQVAFPILHGAWGEDGTIQGLLELQQIPYVGSGVLASAIGMNKPLMKLLFRKAGLLVSNWCDFSSANWIADRANVLSDINKLSFPLFVKPARGGSSLGISKVTDSNQLSQAIELALRHDPRFLVEEAVLNAREIECGVLAQVDMPLRVSVPAEIKVHANHDFYDYKAKYLADGAELIVPAPLSQDQVSQIQDLALMAFKSIGCEGLARVDFFLKEDGEIYLNEINTMPGFTSISMYPRTFAASGVNYQELIDALLTEAMNRSSGLR